MVNAFINKMTSGMLWLVVIPTAFLIVMLSCLIGSYACVVWRSNEVSYEGAFGKFSARANNLETKLNEALAVNAQLNKTVDELKIPLDTLKKSSAQLPLSSKQILNGINSVNNNLNSQSNLLKSQKEKLEAVSQEVMYFKQDLKKVSPKYIRSN
jgi:methyl-accepting chemotaxis protein